MGTGELGALDCGPDAAVVEDEHGPQGDQQELRLVHLQLQVLAGGLACPSQESDNVLGDLGLVRLRLLVAHLGVVHSFIVDWLQRAFSTEKRQNGPT